MRSLFKAYWAFTKNMEKGLKDYGLNYGNPKIILYLSSNEGCRQIDIARECYVETATLSTVLSNMEKNGLIERRRLEDNKRSYAIYPTEKGREIFRLVRNQYNDTYDIAFAGFSGKELEELSSYLERVSENLKRANKKEKQGKL